MNGFNAVPSNAAALQVSLMLLWWPRSGAGGSPATGSTGDPPVERMLAW